MSDELKKLDNIYLDLAKGAYPNSAVSLTMEDLSEKQLEKLLSGKSVKFDFSESATYKGKFIPGGQAPDVNYKLYLQPDTSLLHGPIDGNEVDAGYLTNTLAGFNAYFLTDTETISPETKNAYITIRGSDGEFQLNDMSNWNDWLLNDATFALFDAHIPQAQLATIGIKHKLDSLADKGSKAKLDLTGHSLGTIVTAQGVAGLDSKDWDRIGDIVLFNGPDPTASLKQMGLTKEEIAKLSDKTTYYLNPFDMVSMLNRNSPYHTQFGEVKIMVPRTYTTALVKDDSAHLFGQYQVGADGEILVASKDYHPELLEAGQKLAALNDKYLGLVAKELREQGLKTLGALSVRDLFGVKGYFAKPSKTELERLFQAYVREYNQLVIDTKKASMVWNEEELPRYQERIRQSSGGTKIQLRSELLQTAVQHALTRTDEMTREATGLLETAKEEMRQLVTDTMRSAYEMAQHLSPWEVEELLSEFQFTDVWDESLEMESQRAIQNYKEEMETFSQQLLEASTQLEEVDRQNAERFKDLT